MNERTFNSTQAEGLLRLAMSVSACASSTEVAWSTSSLLRACRNQSWATSRPAGVSASSSCHKQQQWILRKHVHTNTRKMFHKCKRTHVYPCECACVCSCVHACIFVVYAGCNKYSHTWTDCSKSPWCKKCCARARRASGSSPATSPRGAINTRESTRANTCHISPPPSSGSNDTCLATLRTRVNRSCRFAMVGTLLPIREETRHVSCDISVTRADGKKRRTHFWARHREWPAAPCWSCPLSNQADAETTHKTTEN